MDLDHRGSILKKIAQTMESTNHRIIITLAGLLDTLLEKCHRFLPPCTPGSNSVDELVPEPLEIAKS